MNIGHGRCNYEKGDRMKVFVGRIKHNAHYDDQSKWVDYDLLMYLQSCKGKRGSFIESNKYQSTISLDQKNKKKP